MLAFSTLLLSHLTDGHGMHVCVLHLCVHMCFFSMLCILGGQRSTPGTILIHSPPQFWFRISHWTWNMPLGYTDWPVSPQCLQICVSPALGLQMVTLPWAFYVALRSSCSPIKHFTNLISPAFPTPLFKAAAWTRNYHLPFSGALGPVPLCLFQSTQHEGQEPGSTSQEVLTWTLELLVPASYWHFQISMQGMSVLSAWFLNTKLQREERNANVLAICRTLLHVRRSTTHRFPFAPKEEVLGGSISPLRFLQGRAFESSL